MALHHVPKYLQQLLGLAGVFEVAEWKNYKSKFMTAAESQTEVTNWFDQVSKDQWRLDELVKENIELKALLAKTPALLQPNFLTEMVRHADKNDSKDAMRYSDYMKEVALYIFSLAGPLAYETLHLNLPGSLPSLRTVRRKLAEKEMIEEATFRFEEIAARIKQRGECPFVCLSEDDTKLEERLRYDFMNDTIVGLQLPLNNDGIPVKGTFKFTTLRAVQIFIRTAPRVSYAKLMSVRTIGEKSSVYTLVVYGTRGSDKATEVRARWAYVTKCFAAIGITVIGKNINSKVFVNKEH